jgi:hypothetical protein
LDYTFTASGARGYIYSPSNGSQLSASATFCWSLVGVPADYWLDVGTSQGVGDISAGLVTGTCKTVNNIPTGGKTIWVRLWTRVPPSSGPTGVWVWSQVTYRGPN